MGNIITYLRWRGDLTLQEKPLNQIDTLAFALLSYLDFSGVFSAPAEELTVAQAAARWLALGKASAAQIPSCPALLQQMAKSARFQNAVLSRYVDEIDPDCHKQFSALCIEPEDGRFYVAYRGTDDTLTGWREDFSISYEETEAQRRAVQYLEAAAANTEKELVLCGHSKGGNLAVYAAMMADERVQNQIVQIYTFDGPGLCPETTPEDRYQNLESKIVRIRPRYTVIGMLFDRQEPFTMVNSSASGILQHGAFTWQIAGGEWDTAESLAPGCAPVNEVFDQWIESADAAHRQSFTNDLFEALGAGGAATFAELSKSSVGGFEEILYAMVGGSTRKSKRMVRSFLKSAVTGISHLDLLHIFKTKRIYPSGALFLVGVFFLAAPEYAHHVLGTAFFLWLLGYSAYQLVGFYEKYRQGKPFDKGKALFYGVITLVEMMCIWQNSIAVFSTNPVLALFFGWRGWKQCMGAAAHRARHAHWWGLPLADAVLSCVLGIIALVSSSQVMIPYILTAGTYLTLYGMVRQKFIESSYKKTAVPF